MGLDRFVLKKQKLEKLSQKQLDQTNQQFTSISEKVIPILLLIFKCCGKNDKNISKLSDNVNKNYGNKSNAHKILNPNNSKDKNETPEKKVQSKVLRWTGFLTIPFKRSTKNISIGQNWLNKKFS